MGELGCMVRECVNERKQLHNKQKKGRNMVIATTFGRRHRKVALTRNFLVLWALGYVEF